MTEDVEGRIKIMNAAVERAYEVSDKAESVLKICNAPEFFWRGGNGAYPLSSVYVTDEEFNTLYRVGVALEDIA